MADIVVNIMLFQENGVINAGNKIMIAIFSKWWFVQDYFENIKINKFASVL